MLVLQAHINTWRRIAVESSLWLYKSRWFLANLIFPRKIVSEESQWAICQNGASLLAKAVIWKRNACFPDIEPVTSREQNTVLVAVIGPGEGQHQRTAKKNTASEIWIFWDSFSRVFIKQKQLTKHNYTIDLGGKKKLSCCQVTHEMLLVTG